MVKRISKASDVVCGHPLLAAWLDGLPQPPFTRGRLQPVRESPMEDRTPEVVPGKKVMTRSWQAEYLVFKKNVPEGRADRSGVARGERVHDLLSRLEDPRLQRRCVQGRRDCRLEHRQASSWRLPAATTFSPSCAAAVKFMERKWSTGQAPGGIPRLDRLRSEPKVLVTTRPDSEKAQAAPSSEYLAAVSPYSWEEVFGLTAIDCVK
jgi:hypothetical protein